MRYFILSDYDAILYFVPENLSEQFYDFDTELEEVSVDGTKEEFDKKI